MDGAWIDNAMWGASAAAQLALLVTVVKGSLYKRFPLFTCFVVLSIISDPILLVSHRTKYAYSIAYFALRIPEALLELGVLIEIASNVVRPVRRSLPVGMLWLMGVLVVLGSIGGIGIAVYAHPQTFNLIMSYYFRVTFGMAVLRLLIFSAIVGFAQLLGIGWRNHVLQLATGLAFYGGVNLGVEFYFYQYGTNNYSLYLMLTRFQVATYVLTLGYWIWSFARQEAPRKNFSPQMEKLLVSLSGSARATREALRPGGRQ